MSINGNPIKHTSQYIDNSSFDESLGVSMVEIIGSDGATVGEYNLLYEIVGNYVYVGQSSGTDGSQAIWRIKRLDTVNGKLFFADNVKSFTKTWSDRSLYTY